MTWIELPNQRGRGSKAFQDTVNPLLGAYDGQAGSRWHYSSVLDSGLFDAEVDLSPQRITSGGHDGWRSITVPWHHFLGNPNGIASDGWVGFGGRQGNRWLLQRLMRVGYVHWPTRTWTDVLGSPTYTRAGNLSRDTGSVLIPTNQQELAVGSTASWRNVWTPPGGGEVYPIWKSDGNRLKEEIIFDQGARDYIGAQYPGGSTQDTYLAAVFRLGSAGPGLVAGTDLSNLPRWLRQGVLMDTDGDFDDLDGTVPIEVQNAAQEVLFTLPLSFAFVRDANGVVQLDSMTKLRKRIYKDGSDYFLLVGAKVADLQGLPAGDLVFDPTVDEDVGTGNDDGIYIYGDAWYKAIGTMSLGNWYGSSNIAYARFTTVAIEGTIDVCYATFVADAYGDGAGDFVVAFEDADSAAEPSGSPGDVMTTAQHEMIPTDPWIGTVSYNTPSLVGSCQEVVDRGGWSSGNNMVVWVDDDSSANDRVATTYDGDSGSAPALHVEYTAGVGGINLGAAFHHLNKNIGR